MANFKLISDSSCDLPKSYILENNIDIVPYYVTFDGLKYYKEGVDIEIEEFYERILEKNVFPKTSLPPIQDYIDIFRKTLELGLDIVCVCLTAKFSGSVQSAFNAKNMLLDEFPDRRIEIIDSVNVTGIQGILIMEMVRMQKDGLPLEEILEKVEIIKTDRKAYFTVDSLEYLQRGGRIGKATSLAGSLFNIKPILMFDDGELLPHSKARGRKKAISEVVEIYLKNLPANYEDYELFIVDSACKEEAMEVRDLLISKGYKIEMPIFNVGATITVHSGPKLLGIGYFRKYDTI